MNIQWPETVADVEEYIRYHETQLGFRPNIIGTTSENWKKLKQEAQSYVRYPQVVQEITALSIQNISVVAIKW